MPAQSDGASSPVGLSDSLVVLVNGRVHAHEVKGPDPAVWGDEQAGAQP